MPLRICSTCTLKAYYIGTLDEIITRCQASHEKDRSSFHLTYARTEYSKIILHTALNII